MAQIGGTQSGHTLIGMAHLEPIPECSSEIRIYKIKFDRNQLQSKSNPSQMEVELSHIDIFLYEFLNFEISE